MESTRRVVSAGAPGLVVGMIGLGLMGRALAERLVAGGCELLGYDIAPAAVAGFAGLGGRVGADAAAVFSGADVVLLSLPSDSEVEVVLREAEPALRPGHLVVDTTTGDPAQAPVTLARLAVRGVDYLDATISGSSEQMRQGQAVWMVGGRQETFDRCEWLWRRSARTVIHTGPCGSGARMKLVTNLVLGLNRAALAEGLALAAALGLDMDKALEVLRRSMAYSRIMDSKGEKMVRGDFEPQARLSQHLKDVRLILKAAAESGQGLPFSEVHRDVLELAERLGWGELDNSAIYRVIGARRTGAVEA